MGQQSLGELDRLRQRVCKRSVEEQTLECKQIVGPSLGRLDQQCLGEQKLVMDLKEERRSPQEIQQNVEELSLGETGK